MTANEAATTVRTNRVAGERRRPRHSAHAAKHAADAAEWPLGNDMPDKGASGPTVGRGRWTIALTRLLARPTPSTVTARKITTPRDRVRTTSNTATAAVITTTIFVLPRLVKRRRKRVLTSVACADAQRAMWRSFRTMNDCRRTSKASTATATSIASAMVSARPVTRAGLRRSRTNAVSRRCVASSCWTARAVACTGPWLTRSASRLTTTKTKAASTAASAPAMKNTMSTAIDPPGRAVHCGCSRQGGSATAAYPAEERKS